MGIGRFFQLGYCGRYLFPPILHKILDLSRAQFLRVCRVLSIRSYFLKDVAVCRCPLLDSGLPVIRIVPGQRPSVDIQSHSRCLLICVSAPFQSAVVPGSFRLQILFLRWRPCFLCHDHGRFFHRTTIEFGWAGHIHASPNCPVGCR